MLPHPHVVDFVRMRQPRPVRHSELRVGTHLAGLGLPTDPVRLVDALTRAVRGMDDVRLTRARPRDGARRRAPSTYDLRTVREIDRMVRPPAGRCGCTARSRSPSCGTTSSGSTSRWCPGCSARTRSGRRRAPTSGHSRCCPPARTPSAQQPCLTYEDDGSVDDLADSFAKALWTAREQGCVWRADPEARWAERVRVAEALRGLYERLLGLDRR